MQTITSKLSDGQRITLRQDIACGVVEAWVDDVCIGRSYGTLTQAVFQAYAYIRLGDGPSFDPLPSLTAWVMAGGAM